jgi:hypothetical protein
VIQIPVPAEKSTYGPAGFKPGGEGVSPGRGVSGATEGESFGCVDSPRVGIFSVIFGTLDGLGVLVAEKKLQATEMDRIVDKARIRVLFILPPEEVLKHCIAYNIKRKPSSRMG